MISTTRVMSDPRLAQRFTVYRSTGSFINGRWTESTPVEIEMIGIITVMSQKEVDMQPEADRIKGAMVFRSKDPLYVTRTGEDETEGTSDKILWRGNYYKLFQIGEYQDYGHYRAVGERIKGS